MTAPTHTLSPPTNPPWPEQGQWTYADWERLPDDGTRYEVIDGELYMSPPPAVPHQFSSNRLATAMTNHADAKKLGHVLTAPVGVLLPGQPVPLLPDIVFVSAARKAIIGKKFIEGVPDLMVEILSPGNWPYDRNEKFRVYQDAGVPEYWIVDYRAKTVEVFALEEGEYALVNKWGLDGAAASSALTGFQIAVADIFRDL
jgi:Uma2 family endonuclease